MVYPRRIRIHRGTRLESESDPDDVDMDVDDSAASEDGVGEPDNDDPDADADGDRDDGDDDDDELESEQGVPSAPSARLKIKLKMPVPSRNDTPVIESEDEDEVMESEGGELYSEDEDEDEQQPKMKHPLTSRQAVLASVSDASHVSLESVRGLGRGRGRGRLIGEAEMKLRREETARKRRNFVEKKLEDEKAETINRLLKKQSRPRGKRAKDVAPPTADADSDEEEIPQIESEPPPPPPPPTMYRWISTSRSSSTTESMTFSIPPSLSHANSTPPQEITRPPRPTSCAAPGCAGPFRYRLVKDWTRGACGIDCLKVLEGALVGM